jgi:hypothetical protein
MDDAIYVEEETVRETLEIESRLRAMGYAVLPEVLQAGGDFDFTGTTVAEIVAEADRYLVHQQTVDLAGARILAAIGELAVKAQAYDAIAKIAGGDSQSTH